MEFIKNKNIFAILSSVDSNKNVADCHKIENICSLI